MEATVSARSGRLAGTQAAAGVFNSGRASI
jgi:hypothetical protein